MPRDFIGIYKILMGDLSWEKIASVFDKVWALNIERKYIYLRLSLPTEMVEKVRDFIGMGHISKGPNCKKGLNVLEIKNRDHIIYFLLKIINHIEMRKLVITYVLENYPFKRELDKKFDVHVYNKLREVWKLKVKAKMVEEKILNSEKIEGGEE